MARVQRRWHENRDDHRDAADGDRDHLPHHEVVRVPGDVEARDPADRPEPVADEGDHGEQEQPVEPAQDQAHVEDAERTATAAPRAVPCLGDQSTFTTAVDGAFWLKYFSKTRSAAGAAADEP